MASVISAVGAIAASVLLLAGCVPAPSTVAPAPGCPELPIDHFAGSVGMEFADPEAIAESVGIGGMLEDVCAYGFEDDERSVVAFHLAAPTDAELEAFSARMAEILPAAGFEDFRPLPRGISFTHDG